MTLKHLDNYYSSYDEPIQGALLFLRQFMLEFHPEIEEHFKYSTAYFTFRGKALCYLSVRKKDKQTYIGFVNGHKIQHKALLAEGRSQIKVYYFSPDKDLDTGILSALLELAISLA